MYDYIKYRFVSSGNDKIDKLIKQFDKQIKIEYKFANGKKELCVSYWKKLLFINTINFTMIDWNEIRKNDYWQVIDTLQGIEKDKYKLKKINEYNGKKNRINSNSWN